MADRKTRYERRQRARERRLKESRTARLLNLRRVLLIVTGGLAAVALVAGGIYLLAVNTKELPPTGFGPNHLETFPPRQINTVPIPRREQEHVMERGGGHHQRGSMLVQYNCRDYECEPELVENLAEIVRSYPPNVYMAPYPGMDAKIALTAPSRLTTLETLDEEKIRDFLDKNLSR